MFCLHRFLFPSLSAKKEKVIFSANSKAQISYAKWQPFSFCYKYLGSVETTENILKDCDGRSWLKAIISLHNRRLLFLNNRMAIESIIKITSIKTRRQNAWKCVTRILYISSFLLCNIKQKLSSNWPMERFQVKAIFGWQKVQPNIWYGNRLNLSAWANLASSKLVHDSKNSHDLEILSFAIRN